jgi:hypothetical protein
MRHSQGGDNAHSGARVRQDRAEAEGHGAPSAVGPTALHEAEAHGDFMAFADLGPIVSEGAP